MNAKVLLLRTHLQIGFYGIMEAGPGAGFSGSTRGARGAWKIKSLAARCLPQNERQVIRNRRLLPGRAVLLHHIRELLRGQDSIRAWFNRERYEWELTRCLEDRNQVGKYRFLSRESAVSVALNRDTIYFTNRYPPFRNYFVGFLSEISQNMICL